MKVFLKPGDRIEALSELEVGEDGEFQFTGLSEAAEGRNCAILREEEGHPFEGAWYEVFWDNEAKKWYYDDEDPCE